MQNFFFTWDKQNTQDHLEIDHSIDEYFVTSNDEKLFDFSSTSFQSAFGHSNKKIISAITTQLNKMPISSAKMITDQKKSVTTRLLDFMGSKDGKVFYTTGGAESVENALKMARDISGKEYVLARQNSYHGATIGALSVTGDWRHDNHKALVEKTIRIPEPNQDPELLKTEKIINEHGAEKIAAFCLETITGANGVIIPDKKWFQGIQSLCDKYGILLILDEVFCGFGRTGAPFAYHHYPNLRPDFVCISKAITGGYIPFGAVLVSEKNAKHYDDKILSCGLTQYGTPLGLAALNAVLDHFEDDKFTKNLQDLTRMMEKHVLRLSKFDAVTNTRHIGLLALLDLNKELTYQTLWDNGLYIVKKKNWLLLAPPLTTRPEVLHRSFEKLEELI